MRSITDAEKMMVKGILDSSCILNNNLIEISGNKNITEENDDKQQVNDDFYHFDDAYDVFII